MLQTGDEDQVSFYNTACNMFRQEHADLPYPYIDERAEGQRREQSLSSNSPVARVYTYISS